ncbi:cytochrome P450 71AU50-like [Solanum stenotomum]|uniref:cytochrome P450 71AU50-like n=1 Tax=Solanum stenotomum TaxID=172797 RepID=UPI0020D0FD5A|nr:cytochrome P450 71AU50-like [Solanum stenotomum]
MALFWTTLPIVVALLYLLHEIWRNNKRKKLPPSPKEIPILGHLHHLLGKNPHQDLNILAKKYGPIMYLRLGFVDNIIVSSPQVAEQFLKTYDQNFASRPPHEASKYISYDQNNLTFGTYGPYWRNMRKLCTLELLSTLKINSFQSMRREELNLLIETLKKKSHEKIVVDLSEIVTRLSVDISCRMIFGKKYKDDQEFGGKGFKSVVNEGLQLAAAPNLGDFFPFLGKLDLQGLTKRMKAASKVFDNFLEKIIDEHEETDKKGQHQNNKDFVDTMLNIMKSGETEFQFDRGHVKAILLDMLIASMDTSATAIDWILSELVRQPNIMKKLQKEFEEKIGMKRMVEELDLEKLEYLNMVIKESLRLHPVAPFLIPHQSIEDSTIDGYFIPKKSRILVNTYAIGRDPHVWPNNSDEFIPERFVGSSIDLRGHDFELLPFGSGRRRCPGLRLGLIMIRLIVAQLVHCFDWELPNGMLPNDLDMSEEFGLVTPRAKHLMAIPNYRLSM